MCFECVKPKVSPKKSPISRCNPGTHHHRKVPGYVQTFPEISWEYQIKVEKADRLFKARSHHGDKPTRSKLSAVAFFSSSVIVSSDEAAAQCFLPLSCQQCVPLLSSAQRRAVLFGICPKKPCGSRRSFLDRLPLLPSNAFKAIHF